MYEPGKSVCNIFYGFVVELYIDIGWIREEQKRIKRTSVRKGMFGL